MTCSLSLRMSSLIRALSSSLFSFWSWQSLLLVSSYVYVLFFFFFFFQAEDGIRDLIVTGVQTCALPISASNIRPGDARRILEAVGARARHPPPPDDPAVRTLADDRAPSGVQRDRKSVV